MQDKIVESVIDQFKSRSEAGIKKYGTTLSENNEPIEERLKHLREELIDALLYIAWIEEKLKECNP